VLPIYLILPLYHQPDLFEGLEDDNSEPDNLDRLEPSTSLGHNGRHPASEKRCSACDITLDITKFAIFRSRAGATVAQQERAKEGTRRSVCRDCYSKGAYVCKLWKKSNPLPKDFRCPICTLSKEDFTSSGRYLTQSPFAVDHDHSTNKVRGWVCCTCNSAMGYIKDDVEAAARMIDFLNKSNSA
jgi:hypothetical protein